MMPKPALQPSAPAPMPPERRGACPTLARPMQTGDGLLARLRPVDGRLTPAQLRILAEAAAEHGNGIVEITARGSLQVRGLRPETVAPFEAAVLGSGIDISTSLVETPPLAGLDPDEWVDLRPVAEMLRRSVEAHVPPLVLAPKLTVTLDGGGRFHLGDVAADVKVEAFRERDEVEFLLSVGGRAFGVAARDQLVETIIGVLERIAAAGATARGKDVRFPGIESPVLPRAVSPLVGIFPLRASGLLPSALPPPATAESKQAPTTEHTITLGIAFPYSQATADMLIALANAAQAHGADEIRLAPNHGLFLTGLTQGHANDLQQLAAMSGFVTQPDDPRRTIALCAGARGCASGFYDTHALAARLLVHAPVLLDGSIAIHLSGCAKGCAHPAAAPLAFVGAREGYGLVVNGAASGRPAAYIAENDIDTALQRLQARVRQSKESGETARAWLDRLGEGAIADALQLDGT